MENYIPVIGILLSVLIGIITAKLFQRNFPQLICIPVKETLIVFGAFLFILLHLCFLEDIVRTWMFLYRLCTSLLILPALVMLCIWLRKEKTNAIEETGSSTQRLLTSPKFSIRKKQYTCSRQMSRKSYKHYNTTKSWSPKRERSVEINFELELQEPYALAIHLIHPEDTIKKALRYMNTKGNL